MKIMRFLIVLAILISFSIPVLISCAGMNKTGGLRFFYLLVAFFSCLCPFLIGITVREDWNAGEMEERRKRIVESEEWLSKMLGKN